LHATTQPAPVDGAVLFYAAGGRRTALGLDARAGATVWTRGGVGVRRPAGVE
jgi:hypothetical protein